MIYGQKQHTFKKSQNVVIKDDILKYVAPYNDIMSLYNAQPALEKERYING